jgi:TatD DNase family protein
MKPKYFDIHCHIDSEDYAGDRDAVIQRMREADVWCITIGTTLKDSKDAVKLATAHKEIFACVGVHPRDDGQAIFDEKEFSVLAQNKKVVAVGECGLDYFRLEGDFEKEKKRQKDLFEAQINFALKSNLPLMLHCRDAYEDSVDMLEEFAKKHGEKLRGNAHFFAGSLDIAKRLLDIGFTFSFTGVLTFARNYDEVVRYAPLDSLLSETDAPWVAPIPYRGKRNEPAYVPAVVRQIAIIREENLSTVEEALLGNAYRVFAIPAVA